MSTVSVVASTRHIRSREEACRGPALIFFLCFVFQSVTSLILLALSVRLSELFNDFGVIG